MIVFGNEHFKQFVGMMDTLLRGIKSQDGRDQQAMMERLFKLEEDFRMALLSTAKGKDMYRKFVKFIELEKGNILDTRIYFRVRQDDFDKIAIAFEKKRPDLLHKLRINYVFCSWVMGRYPGNPNVTMRESFTEMGQIRKTICTAALPSAIHEAKKFYHSILSSQLEYMDMIQSATEGLMNAIDKFEPPFKVVFGSVVTSRMKERIMDGHNSTLVKIPSKAKRILYRANSARQRRKLTSDEDIEKFVQESFKGVTREEINHISNAANALVSLDVPVTETSDGSGKMLKDTIQDASCSQEEALVSKDLTTRLSMGLATLTVLEKKVTTLKNGVTSL